MIHLNEMFKMLTIKSQREWQDFSNICFRQEKVTFTLEQATKAHGGSRGITLLFL